MSATTTQSRLDHVHQLYQAKQPQAWLTAYDYPQGRILDEAGADVLLCGDSLGMVVLGYQDTIDVTIADMVHHTSAVARGRKRALLIADLPHGSDSSETSAQTNAQRLIAAGADAVKLEGGSNKQAAIRSITKAGIAFCGHLGMLPQQVREEGGYKKKGLHTTESEFLIKEAQLLEQLGAFAIVLESIAAPTAEAMAKAVSIPCIGIGTNAAQLAGQIRVVSDISGAYPWFVPPFANPHAQLATDLANAAKTYVTRAHNGETNP